MRIFVQLFFHAGGKLHVDDVLKALLHQLGHHLAQGRGRQAAVGLQHILPVDDRGDNAGVGRGAANALLLGSREPLGFRETETGEPGEEGDEWLPYLVPFRQRLFTVLQDRSRPLRARLAEFLILCLLADAVLTDAELDGTAPEALLTLEGGTLEGELPEEGIFPAGFRLLASLEVLEPNWRDVLRKAETVAPVPQDEALLERVAVDFAYRSILKCGNDGDLLGRGLYTVFLTLAAERIAAVCGLGEALRRLSREVEHDADNVEALLAAFRGGADFDVGRFLRELRNS